MNQSFSFHPSFPTDHTEFVRKPLYVLPQEVAEQIAAGEVIERPASVVKELLENALDAGANDIRIELRQGGLHLIRITDDGIGIPASEIEHVLQRHTTSKIMHLDDLENLQTLGFRGEALASIAAVAEINLLSRALETEAVDEEQAAISITLRAGELVQRGRRARMHGTTVTVRDLFYNVPARLKYMRGARTENGHVTQIVQRYALGYPGVRFTLILDEHTALQTSGSGDLSLALTELYHLPLHEMLYPVDTTDGTHYVLRGFVANRALAQNSRQYSLLFVNGRWVNVRGLQDALEQGYRSALPKGKHPLLVLSLEVPPSEVDVNVHPAKTEVRLLHEDLVKKALSEAVRTVLEQSPAVAETVAFPGPVLANQRRLPNPRRRGLHIAESAEDYQAQSSPPGSSEVIATLRPLAQLQQAVILCEAPDGSLYLIDQHRAHERIIYEHFRRIYSGASTQPENVDAHLLLEPVIVEMKRYQSDLLEQRLPMLRGLGIECERFGGRSFLVRSLPASEGSEQLAAHLQEVAETAAEDSPDWEDHLLISLSCRSAMRRGRELGLSEQQTLLHNLSNVNAPAVCPHGSPIILHYSRSFLIEKFAW
jgi:DNA mismatch repair protein MutL